MVLAAGCSWFAPRTEIANVSAVPEKKDRAAFKTAEPDAYVCDIVETAGGMTRRTRLARKGSWYRMELDPGTDHARVVIRKDREYVIDPVRNIYAENVAPPTVGGYADIVAEMLTSSRRLDLSEASRSGSLVTYRSQAPAGESAAGAANSNGSVQARIEIVVDEAIGIPVRQSFYSGAEGSAPDLTISLESFSTAVDGALFELPPGLKKADRGDLTFAAR